MAALEDPTRDIGNIDTCMAHCAFISCASFRALCYVQHICMVYDGQASTFSSVCTHNFLYHKKIVSSCLLIPFVDKLYVSPLAFPSHIPFHLLLPTIFRLYDFNSSSKSICYGQLDIKYPAACDLILLSYCLFALEVLYHYFSVLQMKSLANIYV